MTTDTTGLLRHLTDRLAHALDDADGERATAVLRQILAIDTNLGDRLLTGLLLAGMRALTTRLTDAIERGDTTTALQTLAMVHDLDPATVRDMTRYFAAVTDPSTTDNPRTGGAR